MQQGVLSMAHTQDWTVNQYVSPPSYCPIKRTIHLMHTRIHFSVDSLHRPRQLGISRWTDHRVALYPSRRHSDWYEVVSTSDQICVLWLPPNTHSLLIPLLMCNRTDSLVNTLMLYSINTGMSFSLLFFFLTGGQWGLSYDVDSIHDGVLNFYTPI